MKTLGLANQWLSDCVGNHETCNRNVDAGWLPTRLLHLSEDLQSSSLMTARELDAPALYAALSYCWGGDRFLKLAASNGRSLRRGRPIAELPKTFQEAMHACIALGIHYLWSDALCIIQEEDGLQDWIIEFAHMGQVYANATCVVAATTSNKPSEGLFRDQHDVDFSSTRVVLPPGILGPLLPGAYGVVPGRFWQDRVDLTSLNHRAWVLQERTLG